MSDSIKIKIVADAGEFKRDFTNLKSYATSTIKGIGVAAKGVAVGIGAVSTAVIAAGTAALKYNSSIEQLQTSFEVMTGSADKAAQIIEKLKKLGAETPFETADLAETTQLLMNYGLTADDAISKMTMLGDISQGNAEKMTSIATAYGQMSSAGKVSLEDVKQMIEAGFNPLQQISESTGESMASLYERISKGTLAVSEITAAMERATSAGGKYYQSMQKQAQTVEGMISTLKDGGQQLLGNVFGGVSDQMRETLLPEAISIVDEMNTAFERNGFDGLINALNRQIPRLTGEAAKGAQKLLGGVGKQMPKLIRGLVSELPDILSSALMLGGDLVDVLFDMTGELLEGVIGRLPELVPMLIQGVGDLLDSAADGILKLVTSLFSGVGDALKSLGILDRTLMESMDEIMNSVDQARVDEIKSRIVIVPDVEVESPEVKVNSLYDEVATALTDGLADTPEIVEELRRKVTEYYTAQIENVNAWREEALAGLDDTLPAAEYSAAAAEINAQADSMVAGLERASNETLTWIDVNAGRATSAVKDNLGALESIRDSALALSNDIAILTGQAQSVMDKQRQIVAAGQSKDEGVQAGALVYSAQEYASAIEEAEAIRDKAIADAVNRFQAGSTEYASAEQRALDEYAAAEKKAIDAYTANQAALIQGIALATSPDAMGVLASAAYRAELAEKVSGFGQIIADVLNQAGGDLSMDDLDGLRESILTALGSAGLTDEDWDTLASLLGIDPETVQAELADMLANLSLGASTQGGALPGNTLFANLGLTDLLTGANESAARQITEDIAHTLTAAIQEGALNGVAGVDLSDTETLLALLMGELGKPEDVTIGVIPKPEVLAGDTAAQAIEDGVAEMVEQATDEPITAEQTVAVSVETTDDSSVQEAVSSQLESQTMDVSVNAAVSLNVTVSDSNGAEVGRTAGEEIGDALADGIASQAEDASAAGSSLVNAAAEAARTNQPAMREAGKYAGMGFQLGLSSYRESIMNTARSIAESVSRVIRAELQIRSPSRVTSLLGEYTGQGYNQGLKKSMQAAILTARRMSSSVAGELSLSSDGGMTDAVDAMTAAAYGLGDVADRPIYLTMDGRVVAVVNADNHRAAQLSRSSQIALGVGY